MDDATTLDRTDHEILVLLEENARRTMVTSPSACPCRRRRSSEGSTGWSVRV